METLKGLKVAIYARVSTDQNQNLQNPEIQLMDMRDYCIRNNHTWNPADEYIDYESGKDIAITRRPKFLELFENRLHDYEAIVVWDLDRLFRDVENGAHYAKIVAKSGVYVIETKTGTVYGGPNNSAEMRLLWNVKTSFSEYEREKIISRIKLGIKGKKKETEDAGVPFRWAQKSRHKGVTLPPLDEQRIAELRSGGYTFREIGEELGISSKRIERAFKRMEKEKEWTEHRLRGENAPTVEPG